MKKLLLIIILGLLLVSCSEDNTQKSKSKPSESNKYVNIEIISKLLEIQLNKENINKNTSSEEFLNMFPLISNLYSEHGGRVLFCSIWDKTMETMEQSNKSTDVLKDMNDKTNKKCKIYRELFNKYDPVYKEIANTGKIIPYYYFSFKDADDEENITNTIGLFKTKEECLSYSNIFQKKLEYYTSDCQFFKGS